MKCGHKFFALSLSVATACCALFPQRPLLAQQAPSPHPVVAAPQQRVRHADDVRPQQQQPAVSPSQEPTPVPPVGAGAQEADEVVTVETNLVDLPLSVTDRNRRYVTTLKPEDIRVYEDDAPQEIATFQREADQPLSLAILIDTSGSQELTLPDEKEAARVFVNAVIRPEKDKAAVISFTGDATVEQDLTGDRATLQAAINRVRLSPVTTRWEQEEYLAAAAAKGIDLEAARRTLPGSTAIWDAIWATSNEVMASTPERTRRAIILLSDGLEDSSSPLKKDDAIEAALKANTIIYSIGIGAYELDKGALKKISERTGGRAYFPEDETQLNAAFAQIQQELRSQYLITYSPLNKTRDSSYRRLKIEIVNPELKKQKLKLAYRQGYFARPPAPTAPLKPATNRKLAKPPRRAKKK